MNELTKVVIAIVVSMFTGFGIGYLSGCGANSIKTKTEAVKLGYGRWYVNEEGKISFEWKKEGN